MLPYGIDVHLRPRSAYLTTPGHLREPNDPYPYPYRSGPERSPGTRGPTATDGPFGLRSRLRPAKPACAPTIARCSADSAPRTETLLSFHAESAGGPHHPTVGLRTDSHRDGGPCNEFPCRRRAAD